jgi:hypothetical protein
MNKIVRRSSLAAVALAAVLSTGAALQALATNADLPVGLAKIGVTANEETFPQSMRSFNLEGAQALGALAARADAGMTALDSGDRQFSSLRLALDPGGEAVRSSGLRLAGPLLDLSALSGVRAEPESTRAAAQAASANPLRAFSDRGLEGTTRSDRTAFASPLVDLSALAAIRSESDAPGSLGSDAPFAAGRTMPLVDLSVRTALQDDSAATAFSPDRAVYSSPLRAARSLATDQAPISTMRAAYANPLRDAPALDPSATLARSQIASPPVEIAGPPVHMAEPMVDLDGLAEALAGN